MNYKLFRIENRDTQNGLWYNRNRQLTSVVTKLTNAKCRELQMPFDADRYAMGGLAWYSATDSLAEMPNWVSSRDMHELCERGFRLYAVDVSEYRRVPGHAVFAEEHVIAREVIDPSHVFKL